MSVRKSIFALAAIATLGATALVPTSASAFGFGGHVGGVHFGGHFGGLHFGGRYWGHGYGYGYNHYAFNHGPHICPLGTWCRPLSHPQPYPVVGGFPHYGPRYAAGFGVAAGAVTAGVPSAPASTAPSGGCLTKRELPDGTALFRDLCTQEQAETNPQGGAPNGQ
jgi:hypothetical protein